MCCRDPRLSGLFPRFLCSCSRGTWRRCFECAPEFCPGDSKRIEHSRERLERRIPFAPFNPPDIRPMHFGGESQSLLRYSAFPPEPRHYCPKLKPTDPIRRHGLSVSRVMPIRRQTISSILTSATISFLMRENPFSALRVVRSQSRDGTKFGLCGYKGCLCVSSSRNGERL
jgi:hypothetical protein